jgi:hypothetical protein
MSECDGAAVHVHPVPVQTELADDDEALRGEGLVQLHEVDLVDIDAGPLEKLSHCRDGADPHHARVDSGHRTTDESSERLDPELPGLRLAGDHERRRTVVDAARVPGGHRSAVAERGLQTVELFCIRGRPGMLVAIDAFDRNQLIVEASGLGGRSPALLRAERERVLILTRDVPPLGDVLSRLTHRLEWKLLCKARVREPPAELRVVLGLIAVFGLRAHERRATHRLDAAGDEELSVTRRNRMTRRHDRAETGRAQTVHGHARDRLGQTGKEDGHPRDVSVVLSRLVRGAEVHVFDLVGAYTGTTHRLGDHRGSEIVRTDAGKRPVATTDRRPDSGEDDRAAHEPTNSTRTGRS